MDERGRVCRLRAGGLADIEMFAELGKRALLSISFTQHVNFKVVVVADTKTVCLPTYLTHLIFLHRTLGSKVTFIAGVIRPWYLFSSLIL